MKATGNDLNPSGPAGRGNSSTPETQKLGFFQGIYRSLRDFGIGRSSITEGSLGLFLLFGGALGAALIMWARGSALRKGQPYLATLEFPQACGITVGTPVRIRGVQVGSVLNVKPSLDRVDVLVEVNDSATVIPRNSIIEANQSGLIAEPLVDITPQVPIPYYHAGPMDKSCEEEGAIVCHNGHIRGQQGVALDDLVYILTKISRQMEEEGIDKVFLAAEKASVAMEDAKPLMEQATKLSEQVVPLMAELREGTFMGNLENLTRAAADAAADLQKLQEAILTDDNVKALRQAVQTMCRTLEHVESLSADASVLSSDSSVQKNLKSLIQALSRIVED